MDNIKEEAIEKIKKLKKSLEDMMAKCAKMDKKSLEKFSNELRMELNKMLGEKDDGKGTEA